MTLCRKCGIALTNDATVAMGICGACILKYEGMPSILPRPKYGQATATEPEPVPRIE